MIRLILDYSEDVPKTCSHSKTKWTESDICVICGLSHQHKPNTHRRTHSSATFYGPVEGQTGSSVTGGIYTRGTE